MKETLLRFESYEALDIKTQDLEADKKCIKIVCFINDRAKSWKMKAYFKDCRE